MSTALTVKVDEDNGRLTFSRVLFLGSEYVITFEGLSEGASPILVMSDCAGNILCASNEETGSLKLNTSALLSAFVEGGRKSKAIHAFAYDDSVILGTGLLSLLWSPVTFDVDQNPVSIIRRTVCMMFPDGKYYIMRPVIVGDQPTHYWEEYTP